MAAVSKAIVEGTPTKSAKYMSARAVALDDPLVNVKVPLVLAMFFV
jgi:hypothetical protein